MTYGEDLVVVGRRGVQESSRDVGAGETVAFLTGEIVTTRDMLDRFSRAEIRVDDPHQIAGDLYILLDEKSRLFSHSCDPVLGVRRYNELFALRDIPKGTALTFDFSTVVGTSSFDTLWRMKCSCGAKCCRGLIRSIRFLPAEKIKAYSMQRALPDFIIDQLTQPGNRELIYVRGMDAQYD